MEQPVPPVMEQSAPQGLSLAIWFIVAAAVVIGLGVVYLVTRPSVSENTAADIQAEETRVTDGNTTSDISADLSQISDASAELDSDAEMSVDDIQGL